MGLFNPASEHGRAAIRAFPRAAPLIMRLRQATRAGSDVEEVLEQIQLGADTYPETVAELLAFRSYLARLLHQIPEAWIDECQGLTNYVLALSDADRWNVGAHGPQPEQVISCVTSNYDSLLDDAVLRVFGHDLDDMKTYSSHPRVHVHKPHGSVEWRQAARWDVTASVPADAALDIAIARAPWLHWTGKWDHDAADAGYAPDSLDASLIWLPALSIPVRSKSDFTMPEEHYESMREDIAGVTTLVAIGWRARERHFLRLLQTGMPSTRAQLVVVGPSKQDAEETLDNLWETGRFDRYVVSTRGFSGFCDVPTVPYPQRAVADKTDVCLSNVLSFDHAEMWQERAPGNGLGASSAPVGTPTRGYANL